MTIEELRKQFIVDVDAVKARLEPLVMKARPFCQIDQSGEVLVTNTKLSSRDQLLMVLVARAIANQLDPKISADVTVAEICRFTRLPSNQVRARGTETVRAKLAEAPKPGIYRAILHRAETFLDGIANHQEKGK